MDVDRLLRLHAELTTDASQLLLDPQGCIVWCNDTACSVFGYEREALLGLPLKRLFTPEDVAAGIVDFELDVARRSDDMNNDRWLQRCDGSRFWASGSTTALRDENGTLLGFGKNLRNRTDVKEQLVLLEKRVEALQHADEHKNLFLSTLSHELRNPLAPLINALELIRRSVPELGALQYPVKLIERQVEFIRRLVDDLLDVTRISAGKIELELVVTDLRDILARAAETAKPLIDQRGHTLNELSIAAPILVRADRGRLQQVFVNLLTNAAKYTPEGGRLEVRASMDASEALVHVMDNGLGIPKDMQPDIFELFTQVRAASHYADGGVGIGLSLVKNFVELHGGSVQVRSEGPGRGSEFTVRLPLAHPRSAPGGSSPVPGGTSTPST